MNASPSRVLVATDGSPQAALATRKAADIAAKMGSELHVVYVGEIPVVFHPEMRGYPALYETSQKESQELLDREVERLSADGTNVADSHLKMGRADEEIVALAEELGADMLVVGSRGLGGVKRALMGSISDSVVRHTHCPVLVVR